jgi:DNA-binding MarR family transcriptional regulator
MVDRLVERGLVRRDTDASDGRGILLGLTEEGRALQRRTGRPHAIGVARAMTAALDNDELVELTALCRKVVESRQAATSGSPA